MTLTPPLKKGVFFWGGGGGWWWGVKMTWGQYCLKMSKDLPWHDRTSSDHFLADLCGERRSFQEIPKQNFTLEGISKNDSIFLWFRLVSDAKFPDCFLWCFYLQRVLDFRFGCKKIFFPGFGFRLKFCFAITFLFSICEENMRLFLDRATHMPSHSLRSLLCPRLLKR